MINEQPYKLIDTQKETSYIVRYGAKALKDRNSKKIPDLAGATKFWLEQLELKRHVDVWEVTQVTTTKRITLD